jgi:serine/threonine-protein kinase
VVDVLDAGFDEETELHWLSMEYLDGKALPAFLAEDAPDAGARRVLLEHLFNAMAAAHGAGVLHRDLKPENVVVTGSASAPLLKVLDFGVAKTFRPQMAASATEGGLGTPVWAAPEQGKGGEHIRPAVDVWALGLLTFFILTGKLYWLHANSEKSSMLDLAQEMLQAPIVPPSARAAEMGLQSWPTALDAWFLQCVDREPDRRFHDAAHARAALFPLLGLSAPTPSMLPLQPAPVVAATPIKSGAPIAIVVVVVALVVFAIGAVLLL